MEKRTYVFNISIMGIGRSLEEAWADAVKEFAEEPGQPPPHEDDRKPEEGGLVAGSEYHFHFPYEEG